MIINLCFHGIGTCRHEREPGESRYWIDEQVFLGVLDAATDNPRVHLSFDDGNASDLAIGLPALKERGLTATFFALAGRLNDDRSLSGSDLRQLRQEGMSIGSHGWDHVPWRQLGRDQQQREFVDARETLAEASGGPVDQAALPLGRYDRDTLRALRGAGFRTVFTSDRFPARPGAWLQARYSVTKEDNPDSVRAIINHRLGFADGRNLLASAVKRIR